MKDMYKDMWETLYEEVEMAVAEGVENEYDDPYNMDYYPTWSAFNFVLTRMNVLEGANGLSN